MDLPANFQQGVPYFVSVRDAEASSHWWAALLDLTEIDRVVADGLHGIVLLHPPSRTIIEFQQHDENSSEGTFTSGGLATAWGSAA